MSTSTVNISFNKPLLAEIDRVAGEESRGRSELIREAARLYIERKQKWAAIFDFGAQQANRQNLTEEDIQNEIAGYRAEKRAM